MPTSMPGAERQQAPVHARRPCRHRHRGAEQRDRREPDRARGASSVISITAADAIAPIASACAARARFGAARVEHDERLAGGHAVGVGQLLVDDEVLAQRHRQQHAEQAGGGQPRETTAAG